MMMAKYLIPRMREVPREPIDRNRWSHLPGSLLLAVAGPNSCLLRAIGTVGRGAARVFITSASQAAPPIEVH